MQLGCAVLFDTLVALKLNVVKLFAVELVAVESNAVELVAFELIAVELVAVESDAVELVAVELVAVELVAVELVAVDLFVVELLTRWSIVDFRGTRSVISIIRKVKKKFTTKDQEVSSLSIKKYYFTINCNNKNQLVQNFKFTILI